VEQTVRLAEAKESMDGCISEGEEVVLDPSAKFEEGHPTFDESMSIVRLGPIPYQVAWLGLNAHRLVREDIEKVLVGNSDLFLRGALATCLTST